MRQIIASAVVAAFVFSAASPILAQRPPHKVVTEKRPTATKPPISIAPTPSSGSFADFDSIDAISDGAGTLVRWIMSRESGVAAYQVYRLDGKGGRIAVGRPVLGSAAKTKA